MQRSGVRFPSVHSRIRLFHKLSKKMKSQTTFLDHEEALALLALAGSAEAYVRDEIPVGAILCDQWGRVLSQSGNCPISSHDPVGHAEIIAMTQACQRIANYRLINTNMTVSLEPCPLCLEALKIARVSRISFLCERTKTTSTNSEKTTKIEPAKYLQYMKDEESLKKVSSQILRFFFARRRGI
jgi:tRNA(adenine34) deaminase